MLVAVVGLRLAGLWQQRRGLAVVGILAGHISGTKRHRWPTQRRDAANIRRGGAVQPHVADAGHGVARSADGALGVVILWRGSINVQRRGTAFRRRLRQGGLGGLARLHLPLYAILGALARAGVQVVRVALV